MALFRSPRGQLTIPWTTAEISVGFSGRHLDHSPFYTNLSAYPRPIEDQSCLRVLCHFLAFPSRVVGVEHKSRTVECSEEEDPC
jgi:hypothetical protein